MLVQLLSIIFIGFFAHAAPPQLKVMFVGNSLTGYNNMPGQFEHHAKASGYRV
ncbi:MAG: hypothetical protein AAB250_10285 [Bdellovibrionota bacterium]